MYNFLVSFAANQTASCEVIFLHMRVGREVFEILRYSGFFKEGVRSAG